MEDQKIESLLNLALDATSEERAQSEILDVGYDEKNRIWQVIVRYHGNLMQTAPESWEITELSGGYATIRLPQEDISVLASLKEIEYIEKPKRLYFSVDQGRAASCVAAVQSAAFSPDIPLLGFGILVAVIDSGVDYFHPDFRNEDGTTRIVAIWDQTGMRSGRNPPGFTRGVEYSEEEINAALMAENREAGQRIVPELDDTGHGTRVLGIAAGNGISSGGRYRGMAPQSKILVVKLGNPGEEQFPRTTEVMEALEYVIRKSQKLNMPVAINLSFGNAYGSHRGDSLLEQFIDSVANQWKNVIVVGTGNEGNSGGHVRGQFIRGQENPTEIQFLVEEFETALNLQIWKNYVDDFDIVLILPDGRRIGPLSKELGTTRYQLNNQTLLVYYGEPSPYQIRQEIFIDFIPENRYLDSGVWRIQITPQRIRDGEYEIWMPDARARSSGTRFLQPSPDTTITIPATASRVIAAGAYDDRIDSYASFSGRGWPEQKYNLRPDLVAPGVDIITTAPGGGYNTVTGTSFAAPFVTGAAALLMQWGIVDGNDPYLYGEKVRAYLRRGARRLPGYEQWPNNMAGYGALCVKESLK